MFPNMLTRGPPQSVHRAPTTGNSSFGSDRSGGRGLKPRRLYRTAFDRNSLHGNAATPRPPPQKRKTSLSAGDAVASRAVVPKKRDPRRQTGIFDRPLPAFIRPQLAKLVTEAPEGERWAHELKLNGYRVIESTR
jgi:ATP-dependent DNA ligase